MAKQKAKEPSNQQLPEMEDELLQDLQDTALEYAEIRDERMKLSEREGPLKDKLLKLMHQYERDVYVHADVTVRVESEAETVKVRVKKGKGPKSEAADAVAAG